MARRATTESEIAWLETAEFEATMREYAEESGKDFAEAVNLKFRDACLRAAAATKKARRDVIATKLTPPYIATFLGKKPKKRITVIIRKTVGHTKSGRPKKKIFARSYERHYSRQDARRYHRSLRKRKTRAIGFIRGFFIALARKVEETSGIEAKGGPTFRGIVASYQKAAPDMPVSSGESIYKYTKSRRPKAIPEAILRQSWAVGLGETMLDAQRYIERKMKERAKKYSVEVGKIMGI